MSLPSHALAPTYEVTGLWFRKLRHSRVLVWSALETLDRIAARADLHVEIGELRAKLETVLSVIADVIERRE